MCRKIAAYAKAKYRFPEIGEVLKTYQQVMLKDGVWDGNRITVASFIVAGILIVIYGQYLYLIPVSLVKVGSFVIWGYLIYKGRMPDRVILPLYFGEAAIYLTVMLVAIVTVEQKSIWKKQVRFCVYDPDIYGISEWQTTVSFFEKSE